MGSFSVRIPPAGLDPSEWFKDIPKSIRSFLQRGFVVLESVFPKHSAVLFNLPVETLVSPGGSDPKDLAAKLDISAEDATSLLAALSFLALVSASPVEALPVSKIISGLTNAELINPSATNTAENVLTHFENERSKAGSAFRKVDLSSRLLPSLDDFELEVDVRLEFEKEQIGLAVPIVLAHIDTDATGQEIWFQMTRMQVEKLLENLKSVSARLEQAEKWVQARS